MPKMERSICKNSARIWDTFKMNTIEKARKIRLIGFCSLEEIGKIDCDAHAFARIDGCADILINRELDARRHGVVLVDAERSRHHEHLLTVAAGKREPGLLYGAGFFPCELAEEAPIPTLVRAPSWRTVSIHNAVEKQAWPAVALRFGV